MPKRKRTFSLLQAAWLAMAPMAAQSQAGAATGLDGLLQPACYLLAFLACFYLALRYSVWRLVAGRRRHQGRQAQRHLQRLDGAADAVLVADQRRQAIYVNQAVSRVLGKRKFQVIGSPALAALFPESAQADAAAQQLATAGRYAGEASHRVNGQEVIVEITLNRLDELGGGAFIAIARDITERRQEADEQLRASHQLASQNQAQQALLQEQTAFNQELQRQLAEQGQENAALLRELPRQARHSLRLAGSLLELQQRRLAMPQAARLTAAGQTRLAALALLHEYLLGPSQPTQVDFRQYVETLGAGLCQRHARPTLAISFATDIRPPDLAMAAALPCALIVNELVANALVHAFTDRQGPASIAVSLHRQGAQLTLGVQDDGRGLPMPPDPPPESSGLEIVRAMTQQLNGQLRFTGSPGAGFEVEFPLQEPD